ncbi:MAG: hypothetical protein WAS73_13020 [Defluviicoccus sp.]
MKGACRQLRPGGASGHNESTRFIPVARKLSLARNNNSREGHSTNCSEEKTQLLAKNSSPDPDWVAIFIITFGIKDTNRAAEK